MLDQITYLLHQELARKLRDTEAPKWTETTTAHPSQPRNSLADPHAALRVRISELTASGITDEAMIIRATIEFLLRNEFGDELANTAAFQEMTDYVGHHVVHSAEIKAMLFSALR